MDRFTEMEIFVRVVEVGGFTEAARRLGISKSSVSKQISSLENRLGARLLDRTTRRVSPTEIGLAYFDRATRVLAEAAEADAIAATLQGSPRGELRISAPHSFGLAALSRIVADFLVEHPEVQVQMSLDDRYVELISEGFDLAIRVGRSLDDSTLKARKISDSKVHLIASPSYLERHGEPGTLEDLERQASMLHYSYLASGRLWNLKAPNGTERQVRAGGRMTVNSGHALLAAAEAGLGVAMLPDFIAGPSIAAGHVKVILPDVTPEPVGVWAVTPPGRFMQPKVRAFIDYVAQRLPQWRAQHQAANNSAAAE